MARAPPTNVAASGGAAAGGGGGVLSPVCMLSTVTEDFVKGTKESADAASRAFMARDSLGSPAERKSSDLSAERAEMSPLPFSLSQQRRGGGGGVEI